MKETFIIFHGINVSFFFLISFWLLFSCYLMFEDICPLDSFCKPSHFQSLFKLWKNRGQESKKKVK